MILRKKKGISPRLKVRKKKKTSSKSNPVECYSYGEKGTLG